MLLEDDQILEDEQRYIDMELSSVKLTELDYEAYFGKARLQELRRNIGLRRHIATLKVQSALDRDLVKHMQHDNIVKLQPHAIKSLLESLRSDNESIKLSAARFVLGPAMKALESKAALIGQAEANEMYEAVRTFMKRDSNDGDVKDFPPLRYNPADL